MLHASVQLVHKVHSLLLRRIPATHLVHKLPPVWELLLLVEGLALGGVCALLVLRGRLLKYFLWHLGRASSEKVEVVK